MSFRKSCCSLFIRIVVVVIIVVDVADVVINVVVDVVVVSVGDGGEPFLVPGPCFHDAAAKRGS
jgi:hypothetical protein